MGLRVGPNSASAAMTWVLGEAGGGSVPMRDVASVLATVMLMVMVTVVIGTEK